MKALSLTSDNRLYVQMKPDNVSVREFARIGGSLAKQKTGRLLPPEEIHLTLIHFGKLPDVLASIRRVVQITDEAYLTAVGEYIERLQGIITADSYQLSALGYARFGARHTTLVGRYDAPEALKDVHAAAYRELVRFFGECGIDDADKFATNDPNFMFAREFSPHVTIYKGYTGDDPDVPLPDITVTFMPLVY